MSVTIHTDRTEREIADSAGHSPARAIARIREARDFGMVVRTDVPVSSIEFTVGTGRDGSKLSTMFDTVRNLWCVVSGDAHTSTWAINRIGAAVEIG